MCAVLKIILFLLLSQQGFIVNTNALQQNKTFHRIKKLTVNNGFFKPASQQPSYRSFQPVSVKYHKAMYPRAEDKPDYDVTSYDTEYGGVVSNFTSSIYDDNPQLYPNPDLLLRSNQGSKITVDNPDTDIALPHDTLADADLKEHNIIDSVTYVYGFTNCHAIRNGWMILIFITSCIAVFLLLGTMTWLLWSDYAAEFRRTSILYPISMNICCCLAVCTLIYIQGILGVPSPSQCEKIALLLHYTHIACAIWILALSSAITDHCAYDRFLPLKYNYLIAYGAPALIVMINYTFTKERYETKHYCWMSIEKGMVLGFMVPSMLVILTNTAVVIIGLQGVNSNQTETLTAKIQELVNQHVANRPKTDKVDDQNGRVGMLDKVYTPANSGKNTDSSETLDKEKDSTEDDSHYVNMGLSNAGNGETGTVPTVPVKTINEKGSGNIYLDNLPWQWNWNAEGNEVKTYLNLCLVMEPFFAINWMMGVVAIENASHWATPAIYMILVVTMYLYLTITMCTTMPILKRKKVTPPRCEKVLVEPKITKARTTDNIPLLDPTIQVPNVTSAPTNTICTISI